MTKKFIFRLLCNDAIGAVILYLFPNRIPSLRWPGFSFFVSIRHIPKRIIASIFWGFYESAETRLLKKYFAGDCHVIELGASSGIVSAFIISKFTDGEYRYIGVEANESLKELWWRNASAYNSSSIALKLMNAAVYYGGEYVAFNVSDNPTSSSIEKGVNEETKVVKAVQLSDLVNRENIEEFMLVCDIEGSEAAIFIHEDSVFTKCSKLFIELHDTEYQGILYRVADLKLLIEARGFTLIEQIGPVCCFERKSL